MTGGRDGQANLVEAIDSAVGLRPEQRARVAAIIERRQADLDEAWEEARGRILATVDSVIAEVAAELDPPSRRVTDCRTRRSGRSFPRLPR